MQERRGRTTTAAGRGGDVIDPCRSDLTIFSNTIYYSYISTPRRVSSRPRRTHIMSAGCRRIPRAARPVAAVPLLQACPATALHGSTLRRRSRCSADRAHRARHLRAVTTGSRCTRHPASLPTLRVARPRKRSSRRGREARQRGGRGGGGPCLKIKVN